MKMTKIIIAGLISVTALSSLSAAEHEIKMLNNGEEGMMVFEPSVLKAAAGDTVKFIPTDAGHNVSSYYSPEGGTTWKSEAGKEVTVTLDKDGTYIYKCDPHTIMAMVGVIKVGDADTSEAAQASAKELAGSFKMNNDRLEKYMAKLDEKEETAKADDKSSQDVAKSTEKEEEKVSESDNKGSSKVAKAD